MRGTELDDGEDQEGGLGQMPSTFKGTVKSPERVAAGREPESGPAYRQGLLPSVLIFNHYNFNAG